MLIGKTVNVKVYSIIKTISIINEYETEYECEILLLLISQKKKKSTANTTYN